MKTATPLAVSPDRFSREWCHAGGFAALNGQGEIRAWGVASGGMLTDKPEFLSVKRKADFNAAMETESEFVYWSAKGGLYFNANGDDRGAGDGGLFALLSGKPALTVESIGFTE